MGHSKHIGSSANRTAARTRSYKRAQERNALNKLHNDNRNAANKQLFAENPGKAAQYSTHAPVGKTNRGNGNPNRLSKIKRAWKRAVRTPESE